MDPDEMSHHELPYLDLHYLQIQLFLFLALSVLIDLLEMFSGMLMRQSPGSWKRMPSFLLMTMVEIWQVYRL